MAINTNVVSAGILTDDAVPARFTISIFGIPTRNFFTVPGGGNQIMEALKLQHLEDYSSSPFLVTEVNETSLSPPRYPNKHIIRKRKEESNDDADDGSIIFMAPNSDESSSEVEQRIRSSCGSKQQSSARSKTKPLPSSGQRMAAFASSIHEEGSIAHVSGNNIRIEKRNGRGRPKGSGSNGKSADGSK